MIINLKMDKYKVVLAMCYEMDSAAKDADRSVKVLDHAQSGG